MKKITTSLSRAKKGAEKKLQSVGKKLRNVGASVTTVNNRTNPASAASMMRRSIRKGPYKPKNR